MKQRDAGLLSPELAASVRRVKGVRRLGVRLWNWLTAEQGRGLLRRQDPRTLRGSATTRWCLCCLAVDYGAGGVLALTLESVQQREEHWVIADLHGKAGAPGASDGKGSLGRGEGGGRGCRHQKTRPVRSPAHLCPLVPTTERYLGFKQKLRCVVNDPMGLEPEARA